MKLIKINTDHYIIVDDSEIKEGDYCLMFDDYGNLFLGNQPQQYLGEQEGHHLNKGLRKVTHSTQPLEVNNLYRKYDFINIKSISLQEVKELIGEVDVEKKAKRYATNPGMMSYIFPEKKEGYIAGYNQALEDNKDRKYTEKDIDKAYWAGMQFVGEDKGSFGEFIQSLQPKTEWEVEMVDGKLKLM